MIGNTGVRSGLCEVVDQYGCQGHTVVILAIDALQPRRNGLETPSGLIARKNHQESLDLLNAEVEPGAPEVSFNGLIDLFDGDEDIRNVTHAL